MSLMIVVATDIYLDYVIKNKIKKLNLDKFSFDVKIVLIKKI